MRTYLLTVISVAIVVALGYSALSFLLQNIWTLFPSVTPEKGQLYTHIVSITVGILTFNKIMKLTKKEKR